MHTTGNQGSYKEVTGDLIKLAREGQFDVIAHGVNCQCVQGAGIAKQMVRVFGTDKFPMEDPLTKGDYNKLGNIDWKEFEVSSMSVHSADYKGFSTQELRWPLTVVNCYTQFNYGRNHLDGDEIPLDYDALILCLKKLNHRFKGKSIGLPLIGCGLAGGDWYKVSGMIRIYLCDMHVTVVNFDK